MHVIGLPRAIHVVASAQLANQLDHDHKDHPGLPPTVDALLADVNDRRRGVPAIVDLPRGAGGDPSLLVHGTAWIARLYPTRPFRGARRGYVIAAVRPLRLRDHHRLANGCLFLAAPEWRRVHEIRQLPDDADAQWEDITRAWTANAAERALVQDPGPVPTAGQAAFLDMVDDVIDATERITTAAARAEPPCVYRDVRPVGERRSGTHAVYEFLVSGGKVPGEDAFVQVRGEKEQRGQVTRVAARSVTVRFDQPVDWDRIPKTGELEPTPSTVVFRKQRDAVATLRDRSSRNPGLLSALVDGTVDQLTPTVHTPSDALDESQLLAFRSALAVTDLVVVLGPPGTGKTRVISQIAHATAVGHADGLQRRVLVTSHTNRAVDNVLSRLPGDLVVVRVGNQGAVTDEGRPYLLETQAQDLRQRILHTVSARLASAGDLVVAEKWRAELFSRTAALASVAGLHTRAGAELNHVRRVVAESARAPVGHLSALWHERQSRIDRTNRSYRRVSWFAQRFGIFPGWWHRRLDALRAEGHRLQREQAAIGADIAAHERQLGAAVEGHPDVRAVRSRVGAIAEQVIQASASALTAAHALRAAIGNQVAPPQVRETNTAEMHDDLRALLDWAAQWLPLLERRNRLLADWHTEASGASEQLYPELIRYSDVIAATSIGTASRPELSEVEFDLVVVDEAGQISTADALVPLVRARRAVLVGDHRQLPPFLDSEVEAWGREIDDPEVLRLLTSSALETLVDKLPGANVVPLTMQRRMPRVIADFISRTFYGELLHTAIERSHRDRFFRSAFAFVDTARLPEAQRRERPARDDEGGQHGFTNPAEARMLTALATHYDRLDQDWAVIVPYRAQVKEVTAALISSIGQADKVRLNVGSVDSFQGGERDVILYGFTRSNSNGQVGFLRELRRANVAFSRAKKQLVLIGDMSTLVVARDEPFRRLAHQLRDYLAEHGDIRHYAGIDAELKAT
ncbi:AAA domain-containing protein [Actinosynnema sp. NPDC051121]